MKSPRILIGAALVLGLTGCAHHDTPESLQTTSGRATMPASPLTNGQILGALLSANGSEITESSLVASKTLNPRVREFANRMISDHTEARREIQELADRRGIRPESSRISQHVDEATRNEMTEIQRRSGNDLDWQFVHHEAREHQELLNTIDRELVPSTNDPEIRAALAKTRSLVASHLEHLRTLEASVQP